MTAELMELPGLFDRKGRNVEADLSTLVAYLRGRGWRTAKDIAAHPELAFSDRYTRTLAEHSAGAIIGGDHGYKLTSEASPDEINEWRGRYESQIRRMTQRLVKTERAWHARRAA